MEKGEHANSRATLISKLPVVDVWTTVISVDFGTVTAGCGVVGGTFDLAFAGITVIWSRTAPGAERRETMDEGRRQWSEKIIESVSSEFWNCNLDDVRCYTPVAAGAALTIVKSFISLSKMMMTHCQFGQITRHVQLWYQTKPHWQFMAAIMILYFNSIACNQRGNSGAFVYIQFSTSIVASALSAHAYQLPSTIDWRNRTYPKMDCVDSMCLRIDRDYVFPRTDDHFHSHLRLHSHRRCPLHSIRPFRMNRDYVSFAIDSMWTQQRPLPMSTVKTMTTTMRPPMLMMSFVFFVCDFCHFRSSYCRRLVCSLRVQSVRQCDYA